MPVVIFFARLDLEQKSLFLDGHYLIFLSLFGQKNLKPVPRYNRLRAKSGVLWARIQNKRKKNVEDNYRSYAGGSHRISLLSFYRLPERGLYDHFQSLYLNHLLGAVGWIDRQHNLVECPERDLIRFLSQ